jgi:hypothetical protein
MTPPWPFGDLPRHSFGIVYADPTWKFTPWSPKGEGSRSAEEHYRTRDADRWSLAPTMKVSAV